MIDDCVEWLAPEGVVFRIPLAGPATRTLAWLVDACLVVGTLGFLATLLQAALHRVGGLVTATMLIVNLAASVLYAAGFEYFRGGQTIGKRLFGLRVMDAGGLRLTWSAALVRNVLRVVDVLPAAYLVGGAAMLAGSRRQRLGDRVAGTVVVRATTPPLPRAEAWTGGKFNSLRALPLLCFRLRQRVTPDEAQLVADALRARDRLAPDAAARLYRGLAAHFQAMVEFPADRIATLSDEQYLRSLAAVLFSRE